MDNASSSECWSKFIPKMAKRWLKFISKKIQTVIIPYTDMRRDIMSKLLEWKNNSRM